MHVSVIEFVRQGELFFCIIHTCISWSVDHAHEVIKGACNSLDTEMKTCPKV